MPASVVAAIITAGATTATTVYAMNKQGDAADKQAAATKQAQAEQDKAASDALAFQKQQADLEQQNYIAAQNASYAQYAARENRLAPYRGMGQASMEELGRQMGLAPAQIAPPAPPPQFQTSNFSGGAGATPQGSGGAAPTAGIDPSKGDIAGQISAYFKSRGVSDAETPYWVQKWSEFGQKDPAYFNQRLSQADIFGGGGGAAPSSTSAPTLSTMGRPASTQTSNGAVVGGARPIVLNSNLQPTAVGNPFAPIATLANPMAQWLQQSRAGQFNTSDGYDPNGPTYA